MNILVSTTFEYDFIDKLIAKINKDIKLKLTAIDFSLLDIWLQAEYGLDTDVSCKKIIEFALKHLEIVTATSNYIIQFNPIVRYTGTTIRLITLLKTITYGTRHFKGNTLIVDEFKQLNMNLGDLYSEYKLLGVVL